jgi:pimeloyl-ACP methyl ester carboxylesterase
MVKRFVAAAALAALAGSSSAQPFNVRSWYAQGQVFVVWQFPAPPAVSTDTVEIYASAAAQATTANMQRLGRMFFPEYTGARLDALNPASSLTIPTPGGATYTLAADEGVFAFTPRQAGIRFFAVVDTGSNVVVATNSDATAFNYDPVNDPVRAHPQFQGVTPGGNQYTAFVVFADGRDDYNNQRPDFPVTADADKNGVPHVFVVSAPQNGLPNTPVSCLFAMHGGEGEYQVFLPGIPARSNLSLQLTDGVVVTPDDSYYANIQGSLQRSNTSWFGYTPDVDPFFAGARTNPASTATVVNFTSRRIFWIRDWLSRPTNPAFTIDPTRIAMIGHSGGGRGTSHLTRQQPDRFAAAVVHTPPSDLTIPPAVGQENFLRGDWDQNLATNLTGPNGVLGTTDVFTMTSRLSPDVRDFPVTQFFYGKRDEKDAASWTPAQRDVVDALNDSRMGSMISWDEREHGVEKWHLETDDATDGIVGPWPDVAQWIAPVKTFRASGEYLLSVHRADKSYPGFFNVDADPIAVDRQPDPGPGDPNLGDAWGTWGGYMNWLSQDIVDENDRWSCIVYQTGLSTTSVDNSPYAEVTADMIPRKTQNFSPAEGFAMKWTAVSMTTGHEVQSGSTFAEAQGVVVVEDLVVPRDPERIRVTITRCPSDFDLTGFVDTDDYDAFVAAFELGDQSADFDGTGFVDTDDFDAFVIAYENGC